MCTFSFVHSFLQFVPLLCQVLLSLWLKDNPKEDSPVDTTLLSSAPPLFQDFLEKFDAWGSALLKVQNIKDSIKGTVAFKAKWSEWCDTWTPLHVQTTIKIHYGHQGSSPNSSVNLSTRKLTLRSTQEKEKNKTAKSEEFDGTSWILLGPLHVTGAKDEQKRCLKKQAIIWRDVYVIKINFLHVFPSFSCIYYYGWLLHFKEKSQLWYYTPFHCTAQSSFSVMSPHHCPYPRVDGKSQRWVLFFQCVLVTLMSKWRSLEEQLP